MYSILKICLLTVVISFLNTFNTHANIPFTEETILISATETHKLIEINTEKEITNSIEKDTSKTITFGFNINNIAYHFNLLLKNPAVQQQFNDFKMEHPNSSNQDTIATFKSIYICDTITYSPVNDFSNSFANYIRDKGRFIIKHGDSTIDYSQKWISNDIKNPNKTTLLQLIDINRDGKTDLLLNDIESENMANSLTNFWIFNTKKGLPELIPQLTKPIWGIEIGKNSTYLKTGWHMDRNRKNEKTFYLIGITEKQVKMK
jgi:hypothetical protein